MKDEEKEKNEVMPDLAVAPFHESSYPLVLRREL